MAIMIHNHPIIGLSSLSSHAFLSAFNCLTNAEDTREKSIEGFDWLRIPGDTMAAEISSERKRRDNGFMSFLSFAVCEWFLMFLLFVDGSLSYLLTKFAQYCELETPCLFCSRLDNGVGGKKPGFYWSLLCCNHREEIYSLVCCFAHGKFADVGSMCGECLEPNVIAKQSNPESWVDVDRSVFQNLILDKHIRCSTEVRTCSCCGKTWRAKSNAERLLEVSSVGFGASKANVKPPLPRAPGSSRFSRRDSLKRLRDKFTGPMTHQQAGRSIVGSGKMSHVGYTKLKISSDTESEIQFSEDDDDGASTDYSITQCNKKRLHKPPAEYENSKQRMNQGVVVTNMVESSRHKHANPSMSASTIEHAVRGDDNKEEYNVNPDPSLTRELVSLSECLDHGQLDVAESCVGDTYIGGSLPHMPAISVLSELLSLCNVPPSSDSLSMPNQSDVVKHDEISQLSDEISSEPTNTSDFVKNVKDSSHRVEKSEKDECSSSQILLSTSVSFKKNDGSMVVATAMDTESEAIIEQLKRQIENDRNSLSCLYKELEEERNAAASAANEAMAMITRLQEEKAALHMEALQYLRMMEEQAEYDVEALERANDLLAERDKELQDLEYELEFYRNNFPDKLLIQNVKETETVNGSLINNQDETI